jgi:MFS family permease
VTFLRALAALLRVSGFRRLFVSRITSQGSDGVFQAALASHVLFNPEQATDARGIALAFGVILLPYSLIGPFAGVLLDRWPRRRVLVVAQTLRLVTVLAVAAVTVSSSTSTAFFVLVLLVFSLNRFVLAGFSASLPHVVTPRQLVSANSVSPTCGTLAYLLGGAAGAGLAAAGPDVVVVLVAAAGVALAVTAAARLPFVGPDDASGAPALRGVLASVASGFGEAARTLPRRARLLLALVLVTRLPFGLLLLQTLLLFRGPFDTGSGVLGFGLAAAASGAGFAVAAFVTPWLLPRLTAIPFVVRAFLLGVLACALLGPLLTPWSVSALGFSVGVVSQATKITVDTLLQAHVPDHLLGRAFSVYDVMYNAGLVVSAAAGALLLPASGLVVWPGVALAVLYLALSLALPRLWRRASEADDRAPLG